MSVSREPNAHLLQAVAQITLGRSPSIELSSQFHTNDLGALEFPGNVGHDINGISPTNTNCSNTKTTGFLSVRVRANHEPTGESIDFQDNLVNNPRARLPESNPVLSRARREEIVDLSVHVISARQVLDSAHLGLNQMVAVDRSGDGNSGKTSRHELQQSHLFFPTYF
jgi:hypothetical protein